MLEASDSLHGDTEQDRQIHHEQVSQRCWDRNNERSSPQGQGREGGAKSQNTSKTQEFIQALRDPLQIFDYI